MSRWLFSATGGAALVLACHSGCSWIYDADDLRGTPSDAGGGPVDAAPDSMADSTPDAMPDAMIAVDELFIASVEPEEVLEGLGSAIDSADQEWVRPVPIVLHGQNMTADTVFEIAMPGGDPTSLEVVVSPDGTLAAFELRAPVLDTLSQGEAANIRVLYSDEMVDRERLVLLRGLDALVQAGGTLSTSQGGKQYSHIALSGTVVAEGTAPLRLFATAGVNIEGVVQADGDGAVAGPGGCAGGAGKEAADCGMGSGGAGTSPAPAGGGGGGAFGDSDATDGDDSGTNAGEPNGVPYLVPFPPAGPGGAGGGGGGAAVVGGGAKGGGSGGAVEIATHGVLTLGATARITASGGDGARSALGCTLDGGHGGGGSGGAILLRTSSLLEVIEGAAVEAGGGAGGSGGNCSGGQGGVGRIRVDRPNEVALPAVPAAHIAPSLLLGPGPIVRDAQFAVSVRGAASASYNIYLNQAEQSAGVVATQVDGVGEATITLAPGLNTICVQTGPGADVTTSEGANCLTVAYIPS